MLPFLKIPAENYRLAQAIFMIPLSLAMWILMAGSARLLSIAFGGKVSFEQYANLLAFSFWGFWIVASICDSVLSGIFGDYVLGALRMEHGNLARSFIANFYPFMYTILFSLGGVYNAIATHEAERFAWWKSALIGFVTFMLPMGLITLLLR